MFLVIEAMYNMQQGERASLLISIRLQRKAFRENLFVKAIDSLTSMTIYRQKRQPPGRKECR